MTFLFTYNHPDSLGVFHAQTFDSANPSDMSALWNLFSLCSEQPLDYQQPRIWLVLSDLVKKLVFTIWHSDRMTVDIRDQFGNFILTLTEERR